ncbi:GntR family transcriptional regulator [Streptomyces sp. NPDC059743]|uniref:GntR family transcriptional regulator n=1 Tax=Streptomyces sp. NPDC059743 TaxID=3346928 RepID=UPI0036480510
MGGELWLVRQDVGMTSHHPHEQAAAALRADILNGTFAAGERLPGQRELAEKYDVAQNTMGQALKVLESEGLVEMAPRRRARVLQPAPLMEARLTGDGLLAPEQAEDSAYEFLKVGGRRVDRRASEALSLAPHTSLFAREAVLLHAGAPWALQTLLTAKPTTAPSGQGVAGAPFPAGAEAQETGHTSQWSARSASPEEGELLRAGRNATVLEVRRVGFMEERPNSYLVTVVRADRVTILTQSTV